MFVVIDQMTTMFTNKRMMFRATRLDYKHPGSSNNNSNKHLLSVNLLKLFIVVIITIIEYDNLIISNRGNRQQLVGAVRIKGLIYNRDGKFIYRPSRANQAHIIVIDDRSPRSREDENNSNSNSSSSNNNNSNKTEKSSPPSSTSTATSNQSSEGPPFPMSALANPSLMQLFSANQFNPAQLASTASATKTIYPGNAPGFQLINLNDYNSAAGWAAAAEAASGQTLPSPINRVSHAANMMQNPAFLQGGGGGGGGGVGAPGLQMVPMLQFVPHHQVAPISPRASQADALAYGNQMVYQQLQQQQLGYTGPDMAQASGIGGELPMQLDRSVYETGQPTGVQSFYQGGGGSGSKQRLSFDSSGPQGGAAYGPAPSLYDTHQQTHRMKSPGPDTPSPFDEPHSSMGGMRLSGSPYISQVSHQQLLKSRRAAVQQAQDLDDVEGDQHVEYYDTEGRERGRGTGHGRASGAAHRPYFRPSSSSLSSSSSSLHGIDSSMSDEHPNASYNSRYRHSVAYATGMEAQSSRPSSFAQQQQQQSTSLGAIPGSTQADAKPMSLKRSLSSGGGKSKLASGDSGVSSLAPKSSPPSGRYQVAPASFDESATGADAIAGAKDPKSSQYWRQYQDQFDIVN